MYHPVLLLQVLNSTYTTISTRFPPSFMSDMRLPRDLHRLTSTSIRKMVLTYKNKQTNKETNKQKNLQYGHICIIILICCYHHELPQRNYSHKNAYQHNSQHGCNKCPDCMASKCRRQPTAGYVRGTTKWSYKLTWSLTTPIKQCNNPYKLIIGVPASSVSISPSSSLKYTT